MAQTSRRAMSRATDPMPGRLMPRSQAGRTRSFGPTTENADGQTTLPALDQVLSSRVERGVRGRRARCGRRSLFLRRWIDPELAEVIECISRGIHSLVWLRRKEVAAHGGESGVDAAFDAARSALAELLGETHSDVKR